MRKGNFSVSFFGWKRKKVEKFPLLIQLFDDVEFHKFYLTGCGLDNLKLKLVEFNYFIQLREALIFVKNESTQSHILITLRKIQVEQIVHLVYLADSR